MHRWTTAIIVACIGLYSGTGPACIVDLERHLACGDGHIDRKAGEQCDPSAPSVEDGRICIEEYGPSSKASCNPITCQIGCCGDHKVDAGEECDGPNGLETCPGGEALRCKDDCTFDRSECNRCGDGEVEKPEECDPQEDFSSSNNTETDTDTVQPDIVQCSDITVPGTPNINGSIKRKYTSGKIHRSACDPQTCKYQRNGCGFCGDGIRDDRFTDYANQIIYPKEQCDIDDMLPSTVHQYCLDRCAKNDEASFVAGDFRCLYTCNDMCRLSSPEGQDDECCIKAGRPCGPSVHESVRDTPCCQDFDAKNHNGESCIEVAYTGKYVCTDPP